MTNTTVPEPTRTIMISADHGLAIVYFLQTDVVQTLLDRGFRVVVLTDDGVTEKMQQKFNHPSLFFEGLRLDAAKKYFESHQHNRQYWLHFLRWMGGSDRINTNAIDSHLRQMAFETSRRGKVLMPGIRAAVGLLRKSRTYRRKLVRWQEKYTPDIYTDLFEKYKPNLLVTSTAGWRLDRYLMREAARHGVQSCYAVIGWDNPSSYRLPGAKVQWATCWSEIQKKELVDGADWAAERVHVGGIPTYDGYFAKKWRIPREEYFQIHGLDPERKLISFACSFVTFSPNYQDIEALAELVVDEELSQPAQLLVRLHPNHFMPGTLYEKEAEQIRELVKRSPHLHLVEPVPLGGDLGFYSGEDMPEKDSMMAWSDVFCTVYSTMVVETAIHDRPVISVCIDAPNGWDTPGKFDLSLSEIGEWPTHERFRHANAGKVVFDKASLKKELNAALEAPEAEESQRERFIIDECSFTDGSSGKRTGEYLASLAEKGVYGMKLRYHDEPVDPDS